MNMRGFLSFLKELNGYKYIITIAFAVVGSWYDIKGDISQLTMTQQTLKETDSKQERAIERLHDDLLQEIRLLRQEILSYKKK